jgi:hypothetical protein
MATKSRRAKHLPDIESKDWDELFSTVCDRAELALDEAKQYAKISNTFIYDESII